MLVIAGYLMVVLLAALICFYFGLPWSVLLRAHASDTFSERTLLMGLATIMCWSWQWVDLTGQALAPGLLVLALVNLPAFGWAAHRGWGGWRAVGQRLLAHLAPVLSSLAVFSVYYRDALGGSRPFPVSLGNNDLPYYAILAQHVLHHGLQVQGSIVGAPLGGNLRDDVFGAFVVIAAIAFFTQLDISVVIMPLLLFAMILTVSALTRLIVDIGHLSRTVSLAVAVTACSSSMYFYSVGQGFFSQLFAMALFISVTALVAESLPGREGGRSVVTRFAIGELALILSALVTIYPHMAFLGLPVLLTTVAVAALLGSARLASHVWGVGCLVAMGFLAALAFDGSRVLEGARRLFRVGSATAGWGLTRAEPLQIAGFRAYPDEGATSIVPAKLAQVGEVPLVLVALVLVLLPLTLLGLRRALARATPARRRSVSWCLACAAVPLGSYYAFFTLVGVGYLQWKWLVFFQPMVVASALALLAASCGLAWSRRAALPVGARIVPMVPVLVAFAVTMSVARLPHRSQMPGVIQAVGDDPVLSSAAGVNVEARTQTRLWDAMWAGYFLSSRPVRIVSRTYFPTVEPDPDWPTLILLPDRRTEVVPPVSTTFRGEVTPTSLR